MAYLFLTHHLHLFTVAGHVRDILNDPSAGVRTVCPSFHGFGLQRNAYDFVWTMSVMHEGFLYAHVRPQEQPSNEQDSRDPPPTTFRLLCT